MELVMLIRLAMVLFLFGARRAERRVERRRSREFAWPRS
jgi:hypothetical protein